MQETFLKSNMDTNKDDELKISKCRQMLNKFLKIVSIIVIYLGFYGTLGILLSIMYELMIVQHIHLHEEGELGTGIIRSRPGLRFFPIPPGDNFKIFTIWYNRSNPNHTAKYTQSLLNIINKEFKTGVNYIHCDHNMTYQNGNFMLDLYENDLYCNVYDPGYLNWGSTCTPFGDDGATNGPFELGKNAFGYAQGKPCIMLRLNRIYAWRPSKKWLTDEKIEEYEKVGEEMQPDWREKIEEFSKNNNYTTADNYIWISCDGVTEEDRESMGEIAYFPIERPALPKIYFPYRGHVNYLAPFIFIQFLNPTPHVVLRIKCIAWDNNIDLKQDLISPVGTTNFELLID